MTALIVQWIIGLLMLVVAGTAVARAGSAFMAQGPHRVKDSADRLVEGAVILFALSAVYMLTGPLLAESGSTPDHGVSPAGAPPAPEVLPGRTLLEEFFGPINSAPTPASPPPVAAPSDQAPLWAVAGVVVALALLVGILFTGRAMLRRHRAHRAHRAELTELLAEADAIRGEVDSKYAAFELDLEDVVLTRPLLADTTDPVTARFFTAQGEMHDAFVRAGRRRTDATVQAALDTARAARTAWEAASANALAHSLTPPATEPPAQLASATRRSGRFPARLGDLRRRRAQSRVAVSAPAPVSDPTPETDPDAVNVKLARVRQLLGRVTAEDASARERDLAIDKAAAILAGLRKTSTIVERAAITTRMQIISTRAALESSERKALTAGASA